MPGFTKPLPQPPMHPSTFAAQALREAIEEDESYDELEGQTDCPNGCAVEPDGHCPHFYEAAAVTLLREIH